MQLIALYVSGTMDKMLTPEHKKEMIRYIYNHQVLYLYHVPVNLHIENVKHFSVLSKILLN